MVYEYDGVLHLLARTNLGYYAKTDSFDGGKTFPYELVLDDRANLSYPDLDEDDKGNLYVVYDRERNNFIRLNKETQTSDAAKEILISVVTEKDIESGTLSKTSFLSRVISKAKNNNADK